MASVLVTGGAGFIGTHLCRYLHDCGHQVISLDVNQVGDQPWECVTGDIRDNLQLDGIDVIVHLAAQISVPRSIENPDETLSINVDGTSSILSVAEASGVKRILFASSAAVYGDSQQIPIPEDAPLIFGSSFMTIKGFYTIAPIWNNFDVFFIATIIAIIVIFFFNKFAKKKQEDEGKQYPKFLISLGIFIIISKAWVFLYLLVFIFFFGDEWLF